MQESDNTLITSFSKFLVSKQILKNPPKGLVPTTNSETVQTFFGKSPLVVDKPFERHSIIGILPTFFPQAFENPESHVSISIPL